MFKKQVPTWSPSSDEGSQRVHSVTSVEHDGIVDVQHDFVSPDVVEVQLPPMELYDLKKQLAAGVPLKQVNCKVLEPSDPVSYEQMTQYVNNAILKQEFAQAPHDPTPTE